MLLHSIHKSSVTLLPADSIAPTAYDWVWKDWLACGFLHLFAGKPGTGKTTIALKLAAHVSSGTPWPDESDCAPGDVLIWSGEDSIPQTLVPRLTASGADLKRVHFIGNVATNSSKRPFNPASDMTVLRDKLEHQSEARLFIIDPLVAAIKGDGHKNSEVRRDLADLVTLADERGIAILGITHLNKGAAEGSYPLDRVMGSVAFGAVSRLVMAAHVDQGGQRQLIRLKSNIGPDTGGFSYDLVEKAVPNAAGLHALVVEWLGTFTENAAAIMDPTSTANHTKLKQAEKFLRILLENAPIAQSTIQNAAGAVGIGESTLRKAKDNAKVTSKKVGNGWFWELPKPH